MSMCRLCVACGDNEMESPLPRHGACGNRHKSPSGVDPSIYIPAKKRGEKSVSEDGITVTAIAFKIQKS